MFLQDQSTDWLNDLNDIVEIINEKIYNRRTGY